jgi:hypothetical protein
VEESNCHTFTQNSTTFTYSFSDSSRLTVQFVTVLTPFDLRVGESHPTDSTAVCEGPCPNPIVLDPAEFPSGTVCVRYPTNSQGVCDKYDFTGNAGPQGVPVRNTHYKGLITLTLSYFTNQTVNVPAFGHAPGDIATFTEDILTSYSSSPTEDPTMGGTTPGLSSVVALDEPFTESGDTFCGLTVTATNNPSQQKPEEEVTLSIASGTCGSGPGIRDKTARLSVSTTDGSGNFMGFLPLKNVEGNKFHWDNKNKLNEFDISTDGLVSGQTYMITVFSSKISPQSTTFVAP